jgi:hypothetical protein
LVLQPPEGTEGHVDEVDKNLRWLVSWVPAFFPEKTPGRASRRENGIFISSLPGLTRQSMRAAGLLMMGPQVFFAALQHGPSGQARW